MRKSASSSRMSALGKSIAKSLGKSGIDDIPPDLGDAIATSPEDAVELIKLLFAETRKERRNKALIQAYGFLIEKGLETARWHNESRSAKANDFIDRVQDTVIGEMAALEGDLAGLETITTSFIKAGVDPGDRLKHAVESKIVASPMGGGGEIGFPMLVENFLKSLDDIAQELENDVFLIHDQIRTLIAAIPGTLKIEIIKAISASSNSAIRQSVLGFLLDTDEAVAAETAGILAQQAAEGGLSPETIDRLGLIGNWITGEPAGAIDAIIKKAAPPRHKITRPKTPSVNEVLISSCDGAGAQSFFVNISQKRKSALCLLLIKHGFGLREAWVRTGLSAFEADVFLLQVETEVPVFTASLETLRISIEHGLAVTIERRQAIPFGLVQLLEATGLGAIIPQRHSPQSLLEKILKELPPERTNDAAIKRALNHSKNWHKTFAWTDSWFDDSEEALRAVKSGKTQKDKIKALLEGALSGQRQYWGELLVWTALAARNDEEVGDVTDWFLVAGEFLGQSPFKDIPAAIMIAKNTVEALRNQ